jgi:hypothetical protein
MMRNLNQLNEFRRHEAERRATGGKNGDAAHGFFSLPSPVDGHPLNVIAASNVGWDHVSVSRTDRCPTWEEMEFIKHKFFQGHETAMQLHVPASDHVNAHPFCLHLWRPLQGAIPRPPSFLVG